MDSKKIEQKQTRGSEADMLRRDSNSFNVPTLDEMVKNIAETLGTDTKDIKHIKEVLANALKIVGWSDYRGFSSQINAAGVKVPYNFMEAATRISEGDIGEADFRKQMSKELSICGMGDVDPKLLDAVSVQVCMYAKAVNSSKDAENRNFDLSAVRLALPNEEYNYIIVDGGQSEMLYNLLLANVVKDYPTLIIGPTGVGKSLVVNYLASKIENRTLPVSHGQFVPIVTLQCTRETSEYHMIGHEIIKNDNVEWVTGPLAEAIKAANKYGFAMLVIEELNALQPESQKVLNPLFINDAATERRAVGTQHRYELNEGCRLFIVATSNDHNDSNYGGINPINEDLGRRFVAKIQVDFPKEEEESVILGKFTNNKKMVGDLINLAKHTRGEDDKFGKPIPTASLVDFLRVYTGYSEAFEVNSDPNPFTLAMQVTILNNYFGLERKALEDEVKDIFTKYGESNVKGKGKNQGEGKEAIQTG